MNDLKKLIKPLFWEKRYKIREDDVQYYYCRVGDQKGYVFAYVGISDRTYSIKYTRDELNCNGYTSKNCLTIEDAMKSVDNIYTKYTLDFVEQYMVIGEVVSLRRNAIINNLSEE